jgi:reactive intermediate/imine deaminase
MKQVINTEHAPAAIGTYSQAVKVGGFLFVSGQIALDPVSGEVVAGPEDVEKQVRQVFKNLSAVCEAANASLNSIAKLSIFLTDLSHFSMVNEVMAEYFETPYPARAAVGVKELPKGVDVEMDAIVAL